jgi:hypothetical protein
LFNERKQVMKRVLGILIATSLCASAVASVAFAQQSSAQDRAIVIAQQRIFQGPDGVPMPPPPPGADFVFIASENFGGKVVKGAPYSAEAVTESVQTLGDGNRIVNKFTSQIYRDSEGRTRREQTLKALGAVGTGEEPLQTIFINDPVAGISYSLDTRSHVAHKSMPFNFRIMKSGKPGENQFEFRAAQGAGATSNVIVTTQVAPGQRLPPPGVGEHFELRTEGTAGFAIRTKPAPGNEAKEDLGKQMIEGVEAQGTRTTITIPAGEIGNERAIEIVSERWYSPELQLVVMTRHSDPRSGETTYKLTNINRTEPAKSLFEVPAGFTIREMKFGEPSIAPLPRRKVANPE